MYTNIETANCIQRLSTYISNLETKTLYSHLASTALIKALVLVMHSNRMKFRELYALQHRGIAMGMSSAPSIAKLYVAIYKQHHIILQ